MKFYFQKNLFLKIKLLIYVTLMCYFYYNKIFFSYFIITNKYGVGNN